MSDMFDISASGMEAQRLRMNVIAGNLANAQTTRTEAGGAYRRKDVLFESHEEVFGDFLKAGFTGRAFGAGRQATGVRITGIIEDKRPFKYAYDPSHPDADKTGYVAYPNVNVAEEMVNMITASRSYEANVTAFKASRDMANRAIDIAG
ncbi:MAG: flagellar basal body rod protein FlgC [Deltaproteobacteria bacterium]|nr:flagellar basal body rod protein FlgC [Deltaproteobacteria bacterium]